MDLPPQKPLRTEICLEKYITRNTVFAQEPFEHCHSSNHTFFAQREALNAVATVTPLAAVWSAAPTVVSRKRHTVPQKRRSQCQQSRYPDTKTGGHGV
jgi:hypothetical protein